MDMIYKKYAIEVVISNSIIEDINIISNNNYNGIELNLNKSISIYNTIKYMDQYGMLFDFLITFNTYEEVYQILNINYNFLKNNNYNKYS